MRLIYIIPFITLLLTSCAQKHISTSDVPLNEMTITELQKMFQQGSITSEQAVHWYIQRIKTVDEGKNGYNAVIELNPDAIMIARQMDEERKSGSVRGPLHGIPFMLKDNINTADKMQTTAGSLALEGHTATHDAPIVTQLREAGAVLLGKTNLSEWANFRSTNSTSGWSSRGGQTTNAFDANRNPCGSSSGSGVAVSVNLCTIAVGTETNGSIVCPSAVNGIVGVKPTVGLLSRTGIIPISHTQDSAGPMARTVADAAVMLSAMTDTDRNDEKTMVAERITYDDYTRFLTEDGLSGKRIGILKNTDFQPATNALFTQAIEEMKKAGAEVIEVDVFPKMNSRYGDAFSLLQFEFKDGLNRYLQQVTDIEMQSLADLIAFNKENKEKTLPYFHQDILTESNEKQDLQSEEYKRLYKRVHLDTKQAIDSTMEKHNLHVIVAPTTGPAWCTDLVNGDHYPGGTSSLAAWSGYPIMSVPMGYVHNLPVGISFFGRAWSEPELLTIAYAYEQRTMHRKQPPEIHKK